MSEEFSHEYKYKDEDIVWVKLGPSWWPGEVKDLDTLPSEILDFKKPPLVIVKFFDEDSYEYVKSWSSIFPYNCERKNDFIKKGMAGFRSKLPHMEKFPKDVTTAELKTAGNPNILSDPMFLPEKKTNIVAEIFGTPSPKGKGLKDKKQRSSLKHSRDTTYITHRRFLGADDYKAFICIQYPGKDRVTGDSEDEEVIRINIEPEQEFTCHSCSFTTKRLEVLVLHTKSHIQGDYVPGTRRPKRPVAIRKKKDKTRKQQRMEDATTETDSSDTDVLRPPKQKKRKTKTTKTKKSPETEKSKGKGDILPDNMDENKSNKKTDIRSDLLAEWDLSDDEMNTTNEDSIVTRVGEEDSKLADSLDDTGKEESSVIDETLPHAMSQDGDAKETIEAESGIVTIEDDIVIVEHEVTTAEDEVVTVEDEIVTIEDDAVMDKAESSDKPKMDKDTHEAIKSCFDFDEDDEEEHALIKTAAASGRKIPRVIPPTERRKSDDDLFAQEEEIRAFDKEEILKVSESFNRKGADGDEMDATFKELMEETVVPELPEVRNVLKCEQNFHCVKTIKFPDKPEEIGSSPKRKKRERVDEDVDESANDQSSVEKSEPEIPMKLINPKKRFVKSFEDFENEIRRKEQHDELLAQKGKKQVVPDVPVLTNTDSKTENAITFDTSESTSSMSDNKHIQISDSEFELKTNILSRIIEEANINEESKIKIMSKMRKKPRTPRNKILESYMKDKSRVDTELPDQEVTEDINRKGGVTKEITDPVDVETPNEDVIEDRIQNSNATEHMDPVVELPNEKAFQTVLEEGDKNAKNQMGEPVNEKIPNEEMPMADLEDNDSSESAIVEIPHEEVIKTLLEDANKKSNAPVNVELPKKSTKQSDLLKQIIEPSDKESFNEEVLKAMPERTKQKSNKKHSKTLGISRKKRKCRGRNLKKHQDAGTFEDDDDCEQINKINPDTAKVEEKNSEETVVQSKDSVQFIEILSDPEDQHNSEDLRETVDGRLEDKVTDLTHKDELSAIKIPEVKNDGVVEGSESDSTMERKDSQNKEKLVFEDSIEISDSEDVATTSAPNYEDIGSSHNETADYAEIQEVVSGIVDQLEAEDTSKPLKYDDSFFTEAVSQSEKHDTSSDNMSLPVKEQNSQDTNQSSNKELSCISETEVSDHPEIKRSDDVQLERHEIDDIDNGGNTEAESPLDIEETQIANDEMDLIAEKPKLLISEDTVDENVETMPVNISPATNIVSQNETEEIIDSEDTQNSKLPEDDPLPFGLLSQTEREDYSPIGQASLHLPEDAILQPKKPKKRKHSRHKSSSKKRRWSKETEKSDQKSHQEDASQVTPTTIEETASSEIRAEEVVCDVKDEQSTNVQVVEEAVHPEEVALDDSLTSVSHDPIPEALVVEEVVHEHIPNIEQQVQENLSSESIDQVGTVQSNIECIEIIDDEIILANEENIEDTHQTINSDIDIKKDYGEQVHPDISVPSDIKDNETHLEVDDSGGLSGTVELGCDDLAAPKHDQTSKVEDETEFHNSHSNQADLKELQAQQVPEDSLENIMEGTCNTPVEDGFLDSNSSQSHQIVENLDMDDINSGKKEKLEDSVIQNLLEPNDASVKESMTTEIEETAKSVIEESTCETIEQLQEISKEEESRVREDQEDNCDNSEQGDDKKIDPFLKVSSDKAHDSVENRVTHDVPVTMEEYNVNLENIHIQDGEKEMTIVQREISVGDDTSPSFIDTSMDLEPPLTDSEKIIDTEAVSANDETLNDVLAVGAVVPSNEVEIQCANNDNDLLKFSIQTNLSNLSSREELSALALTSLAELKSSFDSDSNTSAESPEKTDIVLSEKISEPELVAIEANLTVVSEKDLADGQVEITTEKVISAKKTSVLSHFSVDFSDSTNDSTSTADTCDASKLIDFDSKGTEFSSKAITKQLRPKADAKKSNTYEQYELLDILEGNTDADKKTEIQLRSKAFADDICDFEEHIPSQIVCSAKFKHDIDEIKDEIKKKEAPSKSSVMSTTTKLMERLTEDKTSDPSTTIAATDNPTDSIFMTSQDVIVNTAGQLCKNTPNIAKSKIKPIIISEQIIIPAGSKAAKSAEKPQQNVMDDIEDVEAFVIHKDLKKHIEEQPEPNLLSPNKSVKKPSRSRGTGKAKILQQTIITPAGEVIQPATSKAKKSSVKPILSKPGVVKPSGVDLPTVNPSIISSTIKTQILKSVPSSADTIPASLPISISNSQDDNDFDINSMPIVLSDAILTPESIENMPIVIGGDAHPVSKTETHTRMIVKQAPLPKLVTKTSAITLPPALTTKTITAQKLNRPRILQTVTSKSAKIPTSMLPSTTKSGKYILVPQGSLGASQLQSINKKTVVKRSLPSGSPQVAPEPTGNKIMIVTNQQGQQQRLLLTPAQQKMLGYQNQGQKVTKAVVKSNMLPKTILSPKGIPPIEPAVSKMTTMLSQKVSAGPSLVPITSQAVTNATLHGRSLKTVTKKVPPLPPTTTTTQKPQGSKTPKTILITTKHGQTVKKITTTDDDIEKQVAAQLEAIKASAGMKFASSSKQGDALGGKIVHKPPPKRSHPKKVEPKQKPAPTTAPATASTRTEYLSTPPPLVGASSKKPLAGGEPSKPDRPLNQLVIQDALGNQTTITEGQILALPNETVGGQPHSYVLVTLDQSGNLTPLNNEALMSLDPNLGLGGDLSNMVLQIDQAALNSGVEQPLPLAQAATVKISNPGETLQAGTSKIEIPVSNASVSIPMMNADYQEPPRAQEVPQSALSIPDPPSDVQTIVPSTLGEPGQQLIVTGDPIATQKFLESLSEGTTDLADIIANAEGKSILIQAGDQQILINANSDGQMMRPSKSTDILAAALADTDVFAPQKPSPGGALYPMNVGNVLETSLTLGSPIMTPLEVPSTNAKKVEVDVLTQQVPKNVDLPITITDPNISQTVANQQVMVNELHSNLDLNLSGVSTSMTGPGFSFSLPSLDENVDVGHKPFNSSMPLLNDDVDDHTSSGRKNATEEDRGAGASEPGRHDLTDGSFLEVESRFTLGGEMCSSLSEPPPEMFDISEVNSFMEKHANGAASSLHGASDASDALSKDGGDTTDFSTHAESSNEGSCEIPVQPKIVTNFDAVGRFRGGSPPN